MLLFGLNQDHETFFAPIVIDEAWQTKQVKSFTSDSV